MAEIAVANEKDLHSVIDYLQRDYVRHKKDPTSQGSWWYSMDLVLNAYEEGCLLVAYTGCDLGGFVAFQRGEADEPGKIHALEVAPLHRSRGIGRHLVAQAELACQSYMRFGVLSNSAGFWTKLGYLPYPSDTRLNEMFKSFGTSPVPNIIFIAHLDRDMLLEQLWIGSKPTNWDTKYDRKIVEIQNGRVDYVCGRAIKCFLFTPSKFADTAKYNEYNGPGKFEQIVRSLSKTSQTSLLSEQGTEQLR
jgi:GNAT superfamily N-acetyltransferase